MSFLEDKRLQRLVKIFKDDGFEIRVVGGAVRDYLSHVPCKDVDLCTNATPDEMVALAQRHNLYLIPTGLQHGTVTFVLDKEPYEVTTLRIDVETDGRHAQVEFTRDFQLDAERRDLTINAMSMDLDGTVYDYFGGQEDLKQHKIRFVGDAAKRVEEDYLRILRYYRFKAKQAEFKTTPADIKFIFGNSGSRQGLANLSGERVWAELKKILISKHSNSVMIELDQIEILANALHLDPEQVYLRVAYTKVSDDMDNILSKVNPSASLLEAVAVAKLALHSATDCTKEIIDRLKFSVRERQVFMFIKNQAKYNAVFRNNNISLQNWVLKMQADGIDAELIAVGAMMNIRDFSSNPDHMHGLFDWEKMEIRPMTDKNPFTLSGKDLIAKGVKPGPQMGVMIRMAKAHWLEMNCSPTTQYLVGWLFSQVKPDQAYVLVKKSFTFNDIKGQTNVNEVLEAQQNLGETAWRVVRRYKAFTAINYLDQNSDMEFFVMVQDKNTAMIMKLECEDLAGAN